MDAPSVDSVGGSVVDFADAYFVDSWSLWRRVVVENDLESLVLVVVDIVRANGNVDPPAAPGKRCSGTVLPTRPPIAPSAHPKTQNEPSTTPLVPYLFTPFYSPPLRGPDYPPIMTILRFFISFNRSIPACFGALFPTAIPIKARRSASSSELGPGRRRRDRRDTSALSNRQTWMDGLMLAQQAHGVTKLPGATGFRVKSSP
jgi:hypothetical protein